MSLFTQANLSPAEHVLKYSLVYLGMRKMAEDKLLKLLKPAEDTP